MKKKIRTTRSTSHLATYFALTLGTASAVTLDTTGTTVVLNTDNPGNDYIGNGTLQVSDDGSGLIRLGTGGGAPLTTFAMTGGTILIDNGVTLENGGWQKGDWTNNLASLDVQGTFDIWDGNPVRVDALDGTGTVTKGHPGNSPVNLAVGVNNGTGTFTGVIEDPQGELSLTKEGTGTQTLSGVNTYTGDTTVSAGTLQLQGNATGVGAFSGAARDYIIDAGATLNLDGNNGIAPGDSSISGDGSLTVTNGTFGNEGPNNPRGNGRRVAMELSAAADIDVAAGATFINGGWSAFTWTDNEADLNVDGTFNVWDGKDVFVDALTGAGNITKTQGNTSPVTLNVGVANGSGTFTGVISDNNNATSLTKLGTGTQTLTGLNTFEGDVTVSAGTLVLQADAAGQGTFSSQDRNYIIDAGATLNLDGNNGFASGASTISGGGTLSVTGGTFGNEAPNTPRGNNRRVNVDLGSGALIDIASGATMVNGGWQEVFWTNNLADFNVDGTFDIWDGNTVTVDALTGSGNITKTQPSGGNPVNLTVGIDDGSGTFTGVISDDTGDDITSLTKVGTGTQTLTGASTYEGDTTVVAGVLIANNPLGSATGTGDVSVEIGATLGGNGNIDGDTTVEAGGFISTGSILTDLDTLSFGGNLTFDPGSTAIFQLGTPSQAGLGTYISPATLMDPATIGMHDFLDVTGSLNFMAGSNIEIDLTNYLVTGPVVGDVFDLADFPALSLGTTPTFTFTGAAPGQVIFDTSRFLDLGVIVVIPEPSRAALLLIGAIAMITRRRR